METKTISLIDFNNDIKRIVECYCPGKHHSIGVKIAWDKPMWSVYIADHIPHWDDKDLDNLISRIRTYFADKINPQPEVGDIVIEISEESKPEILVISDSNVVNYDDLPF